MRTEFATGIKLFDFVQFHEFCVNDDGCIGNSYGSYNKTKAIKNSKEKNISFLILGQVNAFVNARKKCKEEKKTSKLI